MKSSIHQETIKIVSMSNSDLYKNYILKNRRINRDLKSNIKYICVDQHDEKLWIALKGNKVVGAIGTQVSPREINTVWLKFISVHPKYRNQGIARALTQAFFSDAKKSNYTVSNSSYTAEGIVHLPAMNQKIASEMGIRFLENDTYEERKARFLTRTDLDQPPIRSLATDTSVKIKKHAP